MPGAGRIRMYSHAGDCISELSISLEIYERMNFRFCPDNDNDQERTIACHPNQLIAEGNGPFGYCPIDDKEPDQEICPLPRWDRTS